ncbi:hypothetical protein COU79_02710 [Candidatus Peregrinibacteria bacterium CG10_big_fil_rev_8_21_14_0_10_54_7]|nr:MAG: hypothetical protein COU79_02710 [Candidatus Peregrinibacteria bacterium CG10_big_fil_rev_8_21_14_0_10_54_7]
MQSFLSTIGFWLALSLLCAWLLPRYYYAHGAQRAAELRRAAATIDAFVLLSLLLPWIPESRGGPLSGIAIFLRGDALFTAFVLSVAIALILLCTTRQAILLKSAASMQILATFLLFAAMLQMLPGDIVISSLTETAPFAAALLLLCSNVAVLLLWHQIQHTEAMDRNPQDDKNRKMRYNRIKSKSNSMHKYLRKKTAITAVAFGFAAVLTAASAVTFHTFRAAVSDGLIGIQINADGPLSVEAGGSIRLTAEGDYGTMTMPVQARWSARGDVPVTLGGCRKSKQCTVTAGEEPGTAEIEAEAEGYRAVATVEITATLTNPFTDALPEWALPAIVRLHRAGIIKGYDDGRFGPGDPVTRGQVVTLLYRMLRSANLIMAGTTGCNVYGDVQPGEYMEEAVCAFAANGWGFDASYFLPNDPALRGVVAKLVSMVAEPLIKKSTINMEELADGAQVFDDVAPGDSFFADVAVVNALGVMTGYPTGDFGVQDPINRAAVAVVMDRLLQQFSGAGLNGAVHSAAPAARSSESNVPVTQSSSKGASSPASVSSRQSTTSSSSTENSTSAPSVASDIPCTETDSGDDLYNRGITRGTFHSQPGKLLEFEDECAESDTLREYFCDRGLYVGYGEKECPGASTCNRGACSKLSCEDTDGGVNYDKAGEVRLRNEKTKEVEVTERDHCVEYPAAVYQAEYSCGPDGAIVTGGTSCVLGCKDGVCLKIPAAHGGEHYGFFTVSGKQFYDASGDSLQEEKNALPPYDVLLEQNRASGWLIFRVPEDMRTAMAEIRSPAGTVGTTVTAATYADCTKALQGGKTTTSVTLAPEDGRAACLLTADGYVMALEYAKSPGASADIRYRVWVPEKATDITGERGETLSPANLLSYDFSEGKSLSLTDRTYDLWIRRDYNGGRSYMTLEQNTQNLITMYPSSRNFETTSFELCKQQLTFAPQQWSGNKLTLSGKSDAVCFQTNDGFIGKIGKMSDAAFTVEYALWPAPVWDFLPEYQPGETPY